ncbi:hypothetical protein N7488_004925 [Penicillium malachiteum]|nr:hypothetical protein N7488_004925 [Penicillium malachiteum]
MSALSRGHVLLRSSIRPQPPIRIPHTLFSTSSIHHSQLQDKPKILTPEIHEINPPITTFPPDLDLLTIKSAKEQGLFNVKSLFTIARAYLGFYKSGIFNVYHNYRASIPIRKALGLAIFIPTSPTHNISHLRSSLNTESSSTTSNGTIVGRAQYQLTHRSALDIRRLIPFATIVAICGEFTPLLLPYLGKSITPSTCRIPDQIHKERVKAIEAKSAALASQADLDKIPTPVPGSREEIRYIMKYLNIHWVKRADNEAVLRACAVLKLSNAFQRRKWVGAEFGVFWDFLVFAILRPRLVRYVRYLELDDTLIRDAGGPAGLSEKELQLAVEERGAVDVGWGLEEKAESVRREWLEMWLEERVNIE